MGWQGFLYMEWAGGVVLGGELERWEICGGMAEPPRVLGKAHTIKRDGAVGRVDKRTPTAGSLQSWDMRVMPRLV